jgi:hypothetical protein
MFPEMASSSMEDYGVLCRAARMRAYDRHAWKGKHAQESAGGTPTATASGAVPSSDGSNMRGTLAVSRIVLIYDLI